MSPIVSINIMGGLGNQLFQIATAYAYARKTGGTLQIPHILDNGKRPVYWESLLQRVKPYLVQSLPSTLEDWQQNHCAMYEDIGPLPLQGRYLMGYFQTSKYFYNDMYKQEIKDLFTPQEELFAACKERYAYLLENKERVVVMHARRTDYLKAAGVHGPLTGAYYREAVQRMMPCVQSSPAGLVQSSPAGLVQSSPAGLVQSSPAGLVQNPIFLLCSDDQSFWNEIREDIAPVFEHEHIILEDDSDLRTFTLLQQCHNFIMANSTFIWWCVWMADAKHVIAPAKWFGPEGPYPYHDIFEDSWDLIH
jgi:hypothetical protein